MPRPFSGVERLAAEQALSWREKHPANASSTRGNFAAGAGLYTRTNGTNGGAVLRRDQPFAQSVYRR